MDVWVAECGGGREEAKRASDGWCKRRTVIAGRSLEVVLQEAAKRWSRERDVFRVKRDRKGSAYEECLEFASRSLYLDSSVCSFLHLKSLLDTN